VTEKAKAYCERLIADGVSYNAVFVPQSQSRNKDKKQPSLNWRVTIAKGNVRLETDYMQGCAHIPHYSHAHAWNAVYDDAVREACETGKSRIIPAKSAYDAAQGDRAAPIYREIPAPEFADVLYCLVSDASVIDFPGFEEWAREYGYDTDSRKAEQMYRECLGTALKLRAIVDLDEAREAFQGYYY